MHKQNAYLHDVILLSNKKEENTNTQNNMDDRDPRWWSK